ncbi:MAG: DUF308 domain-containing protein [Proteobacteria bacterium]|nr:DUF308 domain-containing protein [Pseudomonadota bacterium]
MNPELEVLKIFRAREEDWLKRYYFARTAFSVVWVAAALTLGRQSEVAAAVLLVAYPVWDGVANLVDAWNSGGLAKNPTQMTNAIVSFATTAAVVFALSVSMNWVLGVIGAWAILSGLLQLGTAVRRWKSYGAQWAMILSGAQSALAGAIFIAQARMPTAPSIDTIAGYAGVGAAYFLISAVWLTVHHMRRAPA